MAKEFLKQGRLVLFSGAPCQIGGLRSYLGKPYGNLICQDIICHGVPALPECLAMAQRYNRPRLVKIYEKQEAKAHE